MVGSRVSFGTGRARLIAMGVGFAIASCPAVGQTVIDMPPPPKPRPATTFEAFQAGASTTAQESEAEQAPEVDRTAGRAALDSYAFARSAPRVLRPFPRVLPPGVAQTWPGPSGITVFPSWRWGGFGWGGWGWASTWGGGYGPGWGHGDGWGPGYGWGWSRPGCGWGLGGIGVGLGGMGHGLSAGPSSFRFTPGR